MAASPEFQRFVILLDKTSRDAPPEVIRGHIAFLRELDGAGQLELAGPFTDYPAGMIILKNVASVEEAKRIAQRDPFVAQGWRTMQVRTWMLSCEANNHLGRG